MELCLLERVGSEDDLIVAIEGDTIAVLDGGADITLTPVSMLDDGFSNIRTILA